MLYAHSTQQSIFPQDSYQIGVQCAVSLTSKHLMVDERMRLTVIPAPSPPFTFALEDM